MTKIPSDDVLESLFQMRIRESEQLKTVLELYDMEIHQEISMPNYQKLKTMAKRSFDQKLRLNELKSSRSIARKNFPNFEMLDSRIASALNNTIPSSHFSQKVSLDEQKAQKEDQFPGGRLIAHMIYDYFRVTGAHDTVLDYVDFFSVTPHDDIVQEFDTRWDDFLLSMIKIPSDDVLESLYKLRNM